MIWPIAKGWIIGYLLAGPRRNPVAEAEVDFIMAVGRITEAIRRFTPTVDEASRALEDFSVAYREAMDAAADEPTTASQA